MRTPITYLIAVLLLTAGCIRVAPKPQGVEQPAPRVLKAKLVFIGDIMSHSPQVTAAATADGHDYQEVFRYVKPIFDSADLVVGNLETTLRDHPPYTGYPSFAAPAPLLFAMRNAGVDAVTTANNHICDKTARGIRSTLKLLDSAGIAHTGAFLDTIQKKSSNPLRMVVNALRFDIFSYTYGTNGIPVPKGMVVNMIDTVLIASDLAAVNRDSTDCVIVCYHWGEEYRSKPNRFQKQLAAWTRSHGADLIIGSHPHVVQPFEAHYDADSTDVRGATYYSLGNFVSNQRRRYTNGGMIAEVTVTKVDSLPPSYCLGYRLIWVYTPYRAGVRQFTVLPTHIADTMLTHDSTKWQYDRFIADSRKLLSDTDPIFREIK